MATQGVVTICAPDGKVLMKIVAGCNGQQAELVARRIKGVWPVDIGRAHEIARDAGFGCHDCLTVITDSDIRNDSGEEIHPLFRSTFQRPQFNPRWEHGTADHVEVVTLDAVDISGGGGSELTYNVVFEYTEQAKGYKGVRTWTSFKDKADFDHWYTDKTRTLQSVVAEGVSRDEAIRLIEETPLRAYARAGIQEATMPDGSIEPTILDMEARNLAVVFASRGRR